MRRFFRTMTILSALPLSGYCGCCSSLISPASASDEILKNDGAGWGGSVGRHGAEVAGAGRMEPGASGVAPD
jgi:hypothetical protein